MKGMRSLLLSYLCGGVTHLSEGFYSSVNEHRFHQLACLHLRRSVGAIQPFKISKKKPLDCASSLFSLFSVLMSFLFRDKRGGGGGQAVNSFIT